MPCGIAIIQYKQCKHNTLFKLECTDGCDGLCPPEKQETLLVTRYLWRCEDCHYRQTRIEDLVRQARWERAANKVEDEIVDASQVAGPMADARALLVDGLRAREEYENETLTLKRGSQMDEVDWAELWTTQYGQLLWELRYDPKVDRELTDKRRGYLLSVKVWDLLVVKDATRSAEVLNEEIQRFREMQGGYPKQLPLLLAKWKDLDTGDEEQTATNEAATVSEDKTGDLANATTADQMEIDTKCADMTMADTTSAYTTERAPEALIEADAVGVGSTGSTGNTCMSPSIMLACALKPMKGFISKSKYPRTPGIRAASVRSMTATTTATVPGTSARGTTTTTTTSAAKMAADATATKTA